MHSFLPQRCKEFALFSAVVVSAFAAGCGRSAGEGRILVAGHVHFDGQPVAVGQIRFIPAEGTSGPITVTAIKNGRYTTQASSGVPHGTHRVEITAYDAEEYANAPRGPGNPPVRQLLPDKFNRQSTLTATFAAGSASAGQDFDLTP